MNGDPVVHPAVTRVPGPCIAVFSRNSDFRRAAGLREVLDAPGIDFADWHVPATTLMTAVRRTLTWDKWRRYRRRADSIVGDSAGPSTPPESCGSNAGTKPRARLGEERRKRVQDDANGTTQERSVDPDVLQVPVDGR